jgi:hypothetical protein
VEKRQFCSVGRLRSIRARLVSGRRAEDAQVAEWLMAADCKSEFGPSA